MRPIDRLTKLFPGRAWSVHHSPGVAEYRRWQVVVFAGDRPRWDLGDDSVSAQGPTLDLAVNTAVARLAPAECLHLKTVQAGPSGRPLCLDCGDYINPPRLTTRALRWLVGMVDR